jgi:hypothetical protein
MLRPVRFVQPDEDVFRANAKAFTDKTGVEVKVDFVGWETSTSRPRSRRVPAPAPTSSWASPTRRTSMSTS